MTVRAWSTTASDNNSAPPAGAPEGQTPGSLNNVIRQVMAEARDTFEQLPYFDYGHTATRVDADTFTVATDLTAIYTAGRSLKLVGSSTQYGTVSSSSYSAPDTTVNIVGTVPTSLATVSVGIAGAQARYEITPAEALAGVTPTNYYIPPNWVTRYGAIADRTLDCLAAFNTAKSVAVYSKVIFIPPVLQAGYYYKLSNVWTISGLPAGSTICGNGIESLLVIANGTSANCITIDGVTHLTLRDFGIYGTSGCGNGIEWINSAHIPTCENVWIGWVDGDCFKVTQAISASFEACKADQNNAFRPATLIGGLADGNAKRGFHVTSNASGLNNNPSFTDCQVNAAGATCSVQIGTAGGLAVASANWKGGLIQGSSAFTELYMVTTDSVVEGAHIEPPINNTTGWIATLDGCTNTVVKNGLVTGDARLINSCVNSGFENITGAGFDISSTSDRCFVKDTSYGNIATGPGGGLLKDKGTRTVLKRNVNAASGSFAVGDSIRNPTTYFQTNMQDWVGTTVPCGFDVEGAVTLTRDATIFRSGLYSAKCVMSANQTQGLGITLAPINEIAGRQVTVEAWVYNLTTAGLAYIQGSESAGGVLYQQPSFQANTWERMLVTFKVASNATSFSVFFTGLIGTVYWGPIKITVEEHCPVKEMTLDGTATPFISYKPAGFYGGYPVPLLISSGTPTITNFLNPHVGMPFTIRFAGATIIKDADPIFLAGAGDFTGANGNTMTLVYDSAGKFREISRTVT